MKLIRKIFLPNFINYSNYKFLNFSVLIVLFLFKGFYSKAQEQKLNFTPSIIGYNNEKVFKAKMNNDNALDLVLYDESANLVKVLLSNGDFTYSSNVNSNLSFTENINLFPQYALMSNTETLIDVKDYNNDNRADLLIKQVNGVGGDKIILLTNTGSGFNNGITLNTLVHSNYTFGLLDLDNDNDLDIYAIDYTSVQANIQFITNNLNASSFTQTSFTIPATGSNRKFVEGKFTASGFNELMYYEENSAGHTLQVLQNNSVGFSLGYYIQDNSLSTNWDIYTGNFTNDIYTDVAVYYGSGDIYVFANTIGTNFSNLTSWASGLSPQSSSLKFTLNVIDYRNDAKDDILLVEGFSSNLNYLGKIYIEDNKTGISDFSLNELAIAAGANPLLSSSIGWEIDNADFNNDDIIDLLVWDKTQTKLAIALTNTTLQGYCWPLAARPNETINFYFSGKGSTNMSIDSYESVDDNVSITHVTDVTINPVLQPTAVDVISEGCNWTLNSFALTIPNNWESGYYAGKITDEFGVDFYITFLVKKMQGASSTKNVALLANTNTWWMYNYYDGNDNSIGSKYGNNTTQRYSFLRPNLVNSPINNGRPGYTRGELWIYTWLKKNGYDPDLITDIDVEQNTNNFLNKYTYFVMGTHPEYWTGNMYDNLKSFQTNGNYGNGGNLICLGGNAVFEVCALDFSNPANPQLIAYPDVSPPILQNNSLYPLNGMIDVGGSSNSSPNLGVYDRFDYLLDSYNFGTTSSPIIKNPINLIGTHYNNINSYNLNIYNLNNTSYSKNSLFANSPLYKGISANTLGVNGYCTQDGVVNGTAGASGWECDKFSDAIAPGIGSTPASPMNVPSIYNNVQIIATSTPNTYSIPILNYPNGMNNSEIIYIPKDCSTHRGFVFTAGSITFGGSLVYAYDIGTNSFNNDLSKLMLNVMNHSEVSIVKTDIIDCPPLNSLGSIAATSNFIPSSASLTYNLLPINITNSTGVFNNLSAGTYTVNVYYGSELLNCKTVEINQTTTAQCCAPTILVIPNIILVNNGFATNIGTNLNGNSIFVDGTFTIDDDANYTNCTFYFTANSSIIVNTGKILNLTGCTLQAACGDYWNGIVATDALSKINIFSCSIQDMELGVQAKNNATLQSIGSTFSNNATASIALENVNSPNYAGKIEGNTFTSNANMIPVSGQTLPKHGISIINCDYVTVGNAIDANKGNTFINLYNGIKVSNDNQLVTVLPLGTNQIGIYNNHFEDIHGDETGLDLYNTIYSKKRGAAIYISYANVNSFNAKTIVRNTNQVTIPSFLNCDKGIVCNHSQLESKYLYMLDCPFGIMNNAMWDSRPFDLQNNKIENTILGIQCLGQSQTSLLKLNTIIATGGISMTPGQLGGNYIWSKAIDVQRFLNSGTSDMDVQFNIITVADHAGVGINLQNTGSQTKIYRNTIGLNSMTNVVCGGFSNLNGIAASNIEASQIEGNEVNGNAGLITVEREDIAGILINNSHDQKIICNQINNTRFGMMAISNCTTAPTSIKGNIQNNHLLGWVFRHLGTEGTFGDVGDNANDNNNLFIGTGYASNVFKFCENSDGKSIFTNSSVTSDSYNDLFPILSNPCGYQLGLNNAPVVTIYNCPINLSVWTNYTNEEYINLDDALLIANDIKVYSEYEEISRWMDRKRLYQQLKTDPNLLNAHASLSNFFSAIETENLEQLAIADEKLIELINSYTTNNATLIDQKLADAEAGNALIDNTVLQEANEQTINGLYIKLLSKGLDDLSGDDVILISELANKCPYLEGSAVYKARALNAIFNPTSQYNDIKICNNVGVYKNNNESNSNGSYDNENNYLKHLKASTNQHSQNNYDVNIYPNPTSNLLNIDYNIKEDARLEIIDVLGRKVIETALSKNVNHSLIFIEKLQEGIFIYKIICKDYVIKTGKLSIE